MPIKNIMKIWNTVRTSNYSIKIHSLDSVLFLLTLQTEYLAFSANFWLTFQVQIVNK